MTGLEAILFWLTTAVYVAAFLVLFLGLVLRGKRWSLALSLLLGAGTAVHTGLVAARYFLAGHLPVGNTYELNVTGTLLAMLVLLAVAYSVPKARLLLLGALPLVVLALGIGVTSDSAIAPLSAAYDSPWLVVHIIFAFLAFGFFALGFGAAVLLLLEGTGPRARFAARLPTGEELGVFERKMIAAGFVLEGVMIMTGAVWANNLWGSYWSWDPVETWSLVSLLVYALYLHLQAFPRLRGRPTSAVAVLGMVFVIMSFWGVQYVVTTVHDFNRL